MTTTLIQQAHGGGMSMHGGMAKTLARLQHMYYWPKMVVQVRDFVAASENCKENKHTTQIKRPEMGKEVRTDRPTQKLYLYFLGKYPRSRRGNTMLFIALDHLTKFVWLKTMPKATSTAVIRFLQEGIFTQFGVPETIHTYNGRQFISKEFEIMLKEYGTTHIKTGRQSNASERVNQSVLAAIRVNIQDDHTRWDEHLADIQASLRSVIHSSTGTSPYFAMFGQHMFTNGKDYSLARKLNALNEAEVAQLPRSEQQQLSREKIKERIHQAYEKALKRYNLMTRDIGYSPGQEIYKRNFVLSDFSKNGNAKFCRKYTKCRVIKALGNSLYALENLRGNPLGVFHAKDLKHKCPASKPHSPGFNFRVVGGGLR